MPHHVFGGMSSSSPTPSFASVLRRYRRSAGISQRELARRAGYSADYVSMLERGVRMPGSGTLAPLLEALDLGDAERLDLQRATWTSRPGGPVFNPPALASASPLAQRNTELAQINAFLDSQNPTLLIVGESGIGKTRLLEEARRLAVERGMTTLTPGWRSHPNPGASWHAYAPVLDALSGFMHAQSGRRLRNLLQGCDALARLFPELVEMGVNLPDVRLAPEQERRQTFHAVGRFLAQSAGPSGSLLVLDDLQSAGADAVDLLGFLLSTRTRVRLIGAYRHGEVLPGDALAALVSDLLHRDDLALVRPQPLSPEAARDLVIRLLPGGYADDERVGAAVALSDGLPLYLVCFARAIRAQLLAESHDAPAPGGVVMGLPHALVSIVRHQIAQLPEASQAVLRVTAQSTTACVRFGEIRHKVSYDDTEIRTALDTLVWRGVVCEAEPDSFRIVHEAVRMVAAAGG